MYRKQEEFKKLIKQGKFIGEYIGKEVPKEGKPIIILKGYEWIREMKDIILKRYIIKVLRN